MNWAILIPVAVIVLALLVFMIVRNIRDEKKFISQLKNDYRKPRNEEGDVETEDPVS